ncbi:hypothetical protein MNBD_IGNAVI01-1676 [hydrothermal vent metagenome]|uniref:PA14 domain-containing protein n=1 Tax=hydrothermal vent metagenome TaxID=652676 RepID=A0A3B1C2Q8_9ZZZZ
MKKTLEIFLIIAVIFTLGSCSKENPQKEGLIGIYYSEPDLTSIKGISVLKSLNQKWDDSVDYEGGTSGDWSGYIIAPASGNIEFYLSTNRKSKIKIDTDSTEIENENSGKTFVVKMGKGKSYPVNIVFYNPGEHEEIGWFNIEWSWSGQNKTNVPASNLFYTEEESRKLDFLRGVENKKLDRNDVIYVKGKKLVNVECKRL